MSEIEFVTVTKELAKKIIDEAPGEMVTIMTWSRSTLVHQPTERKKKSYGKSLVDVAREVTFDENEIFQTLYINGEIRDPDLLRNIILPKLKPKL